MAQAFGVQEIWQIDERTFGIVWTDRVQQKFDVVELRKQCPCAVCVDEMTGKRKLDVGAVSDSVRPKKVESVGRYALKIDFNDNHTTGIYSFDSLRRMVL